VYDVLGCIANGTNRPADSSKFNYVFLRLRQLIAKHNQNPDFALAYAYNQAGCASMMATHGERLPEGLRALQRGPHCVARDLARMTPSLSIELYQGPQPASSCVPGLGGVLTAR
jgi:hypothetical protein